MRSVKQIVDDIRKAVSALNEYHWEHKGTLSDLDEVPTSPGVYLITDEVDACYIGRAIREGGLRKRLNEHLTHPHKEWESKKVRKNFKVYVHTMTNDSDGLLWAAIVEAALIFMEKPTLNKFGKRGVVTSL